MAYYSSKLWGKKKVCNIEAFIAPANFDPASQQLNIVTVFGDYDNVNKAYIYSFTSAIATLTLPASSGVTYRWGETISGVDYVYDVVSGTAFTAGSTKRYVIVNSTDSSVFVNLYFNGAVWLYCSSKIYRIHARSNTYLKYVHCEDLNSITIIGDSAFQGCTGLTGALTIPNSVTTIGNYAFAYCTGLTGALTIPNSVTTILQSAFAICTGLTGTLTIPNSVTTIPLNPFYGTLFTHLVSNSSYFEVYDEVLYTTTGTITAIYSAKGYSGTLTLKSNVVVIDYGCFYNNNLRTGALTIPNSVTTIGIYAFYGCTGLTGALTIPNSVTTIGDSAFQGCTGLTGALTIPNSVTTIGISAFRNCTGFTGTLTIPNSVTTIGGYVFAGCTGLTGALTIPNSVTTIGISAFQNCTGFTGALTIPNSVTTIGGYAFYGCTKLSGIGTINGSPTMGTFAFYGLPLISEWHILSSVAPSVQLNTWQNFAKPLHVKIGATGYDVAPFTNTAIFSSIIYDL